MPNKSAYDQYIINELLSFNHARLGNDAEAAKAIEATLDSPYINQADVPQRVRALAQLNYRMKNYAKAAEWGGRALKNGYGNGDMVTLVGQAEYLSGDYKSTIKVLDDVVEGQEKRGQTPNETHLQLLLSSCVKLDDDACTTRELERMVRYFPKPEHWKNLTFSLLRADDNTDRHLLHIFRLMEEVDTLGTPDRYTEMAQLALEQGSPGEAQAILEKGLSKNVFTEARDKDRTTRLLESAKRQAAADLAALPKIEKDAKTGEAKVRLGQAYMSYGQHEKAVALINAGIAQGGIKNMDEANLLLGIAQYRAGKKGDAVKTFKQIKSDPKYARLGNLWSLRAG
jgi:tetratricopeptide (TPR) repeat protein